MTVIDYIFLNNSYIIVLFDSFCMSIDTIDILPFRALLCICSCSSSLPFGDKVPLFFSLYSIHNKLSETTVTAEDRL